VRLTHLNLFPHLRDRTQCVRIRSHRVRNPHLWTPHCGSHPHQISMRMRGADYAALAQALVDAGATTKPAAVVASILAAPLRGTALNRIASDTGIHHKTVSKIIDAAENHRRHLVAV